MSSGSPKESLTATEHVGGQNVFPTDSDDENSPLTRSGSLGSESSPQETDASDSDEHGQDLIGQAPQPGRRGVVSSPGLSQISQISRERSRARRLRAGEPELEPAGRAYDIGDDDNALRQRSPPSEDERSHAASTRTLQARRTTGGGSVYSAQTRGSVEDVEDQGSPASRRTLQGRTFEEGGYMHSREHLLHDRDFADPESSGRPMLYDEESDALSDATTVRLSQERDVTVPESRLPSATPGLTEGGSASPSSTMGNSDHRPDGVPVDYRSARLATRSDAGGSISPIHTRRRDQLEGVHVRSDDERDTEDDSDETEGE